MRFVGFLAGREGFALPLDSVREVVLPSAFTRVPKAPDWIAGVFNHYGQVLLVADLARLLVAGAPARGGTGWVVLLTPEHRSAGLWVEELLGVFEGEEAPPVEGVPLGGGVSETRNLRGRLLGVLNLKDLLQRVEQAF